MTKKIIMFSLLLTMLFGAQVFAQPATNMGTTGNRPPVLNQTGTTIPNNRMGTMDMNTVRTRGYNYRATAATNANNWSWIGLFGLIGLAGLFGRNRNPNPDR